MNLEALRAVHTLMQNPDNWTMNGLCATYQFECFRITGRSGPSLKPHYQRWDKFSGNITYPVPGGIDAYNNASNPGMWDRENYPYAELRWQLLEFLISEAEKDEQLTRAPEQGVTRAATERNEVIATLHSGREHWRMTDDDRTLTEWQADVLLADFDLVRKTK